MLYKEREADTSDLRSVWWGFKEESPFPCPVFGATTAATLDSMFDTLASLRTFWDKPVVRDIKPATGIALSGELVQPIRWIRSILESLSSQLGPPPSDKATAGPNER